jgi:subtilisin family serine protease
MPTSSTLTSTQTSTPERPEAFADSIHLIAAVDHIFKVAGSKPCVINISLGSLDGPSNGRSRAVVELEHIVNARPNRAVVVSAGNYADDKFHAVASVSANMDETIEFRVREAMELNGWYSLGVNLRFYLLFEQEGMLFGPFSVGGSVQSITDSDGNLIGSAGIVWRGDIGLHQIFVGLAEKAPTGVWSIRVVADDGHQQVDEKLHLYVSRGPGKKQNAAEFEDHIDNKHTLVSLACGNTTVAVGAHDATSGNRRQTAEFSSIGPTLDGRWKPDVTAPGVDIGMAQPSGQTTSSGTSYSAPMVTGVVALCLAEAAARGGSLTAEQLREILVSTAARTQAGLGWDKRAGFGPVDAAAAVAEVIRRFPLASKAEGKRSLRPRGSVGRSSAAKP